MAINKEIIVDSDTHALIKFHADAGGANNSYRVGEFKGGTDNVSVIAIEFIHFSLFEDNLTPDDKCIVTFSDLGSNHNTIYNLFGQGKIGKPGQRISEDLDETTRDAIRVVFQGGSKGTVLILLRKVSGFA